MVTTALRLIASLRAYDIAEYRSNVAVLTRCAAIIDMRGGAATAVSMAAMPTATMSSVIVKPRWRTANAGTASLRKTRGSSVLRYADDQPAISTTTIELTNAYKIATPASNSAVIEPSAR